VGPRLGSQFRQARAALLPLLRGEDARADHETFRHGVAQREDRVARAADVAQVAQSGILKRGHRQRDALEDSHIDRLLAKLSMEQFEMRDALQHGDINAFKWGFGASMSAEPTANVYMNREFMLQFTSRAGNKPWLKRRELEDMDSDPSVLDMIKAIQPLMGPLQEKLDTILYPNVAKGGNTSSFALAVIFSLIKARWVA